MIRILLLSMVLAVSAFAADETVGNKVGKKIDQSVNSVAETKEEVQAKFEKSLEELRSDLKELKASSKKAKGQVKSDLAKQVENLEKDEKKIEQKIHDLKSSTGQAWETLRDHTREAFSEIKSGFAKAKNVFKEDNVDTKKAESKRNDD